MLAERGQMMITEWTAIRRRLAVRRMANRPPWSGRKSSGHGSIVAPLAATLAATMAVGVGVALAKGERDRRATRKARRRERRFALLAGETPATGLRRAALGQLEQAIELLEGGGDRRMSAEKTLHDLRKTLKRLRGLMRLLRDDLGEQAFERENALLRDIGRRLSGARDAEVLASTLEDLLRRNPKKLARRRGVRRLRAHLRGEREGAAEATLADGPTRARTLGELRQLHARVSAWRLADAGGIDALEPALKRLYGQGRRRRRRATRGSGERTRAMHEWRKRVKDLRYAAELLNLDGVAQQADELGELLGEEHDLAMLAARVRAEGKRGSGRRGSGKRVLGTGTRKRLLKAIARRRKRLRTKALRDGRRLYGRKPKKFVRRARRAAARAAGPVSRR
jgi:CHAD domain-containing protein